MHGSRPARALAGSIQAGQELLHIKPLGCRSHIELPHSSSLRLEGLDLACVKYILAEALNHVD